VKSASSLSAGVDKCGMRLFVKNGALSSLNRVRETETDCEGGVRPVKERPEPLFPHPALVKSNYHRKLFPLQKVQRPSGFSAL